MVFHVSMGGLLFRWGSLFLSVGRGVWAGRASFLVWGGFEENRTIGFVPYAPTMGNPENDHLTIKNICSILKKQ